MLRGTDSLELDCFSVNGGEMIRLYSDSDPELFSQSVSCLSLMPEHLHLNRIEESIVRIGLAGMLFLNVIARLIGMIPFQIHIEGAESAQSIQRSR
jgi:hypothetical protein